MPTLSTDHWQGVRCDEEVFEDPSWDQVERCLQRLDAATFTSVTLTFDDGSHICVGGGKGRYQVYVGTAHSEDEAYFTLIDEGKSEGAEEQLVTGGQLGNFPARSVVDWQIVAQAVQTFLATGRRDGALAWVED